MVKPVRAGTFSKQDALGSVTGLHYDSKYFRIAKENGELCIIYGV